MKDEAHQDGQQADDAVHALHGRLRRMPGILPVCLQDFLHGGQSALREVRRGNRHSPSRLREGLFLCVCCGKCYGDAYLAHSTQTPRSASDRVLVRLNTGALLKRATLERKKYAGGESHKRSTSSNHTSLTLVFLGRFPMRPVTQSASSCGLASWTGQYLLTCFTRVCFGVMQGVGFLTSVTFDL